MIDGMLDFLADGPFALVYAFLTVVVFFRAQGTYWLGRWSTEMTLRHVKPKSPTGQRLVAWFESSATDSGIHALQKWGLPVVPFSFLTVGFQTVVNAGAGILRTPWWKYTLAMLPGCLAWAGIYSTIGMAMWGAMLSAAAGSPWGIVVLVLLAAAAAAAVIWRRRRTRDATVEQETQPHAVPAQKCC